MPAPKMLADLVARIAPRWHARSFSGWLWPSAAPWGNGDRGPLGSWQMNANAPQRGAELLAFSAVYGCINVIASDIAKLPIQVFEVDLDTGVRKLRRRDYYTQLIREPNGYQTSADFIFAFVQSYLLQGNTYAYCGKRNGRGEIEEMHVLDPYRVKPLIAENGRVYYECHENFLAGLAPNTVVNDRNMIHHRLPLLPGYPLVGVTPIFAAAASSAVGIKILQDSQQFFANSARPSGILQSTTNLAPEQVRRVKEEWDVAYRGREYGKVAVLPSGLAWSPMTITAQDAQLIEQLRWSVEDVARVFRVPPFMLGDMSKVTYRNVETLAQIYLAECLAPHIEAIEKRLERAFAFTPDFELKFDLSHLLRTEIDVRYGAYSQALAAGWQSINEVRAKEGMEPVPGGEEPRVQQQYRPLSETLEPPEDPEDDEDDPVPDEDPDDPVEDQPVEESIAHFRSRLRQRLAA